MVRVAGFVTWPWVLLLAVGQAATGFAVYRLLRHLLRPGWGLLIPLCLFVFSPLTLEVSSLWLVGLLVLPMQLALVMAATAQVWYVRTGRLRHLVAVVLWVVFGLLFDTKSLLIVPLLFLLTVFLFTSGGVLAQPRDGGPPALAGVAGARCAVGGVPGALSDPSLRRIARTRPPSVRSSTSSVTWSARPWFRVCSEAPGAGATPVTVLRLVNPYDIAKWLSWAVLATLIVVTVRRRPSARRAWLLLTSYLGLVATLFAVTRLGGPLGPLFVGIVPRYVADVVLVAAICVGAALLGTRTPTRTRCRRGRCRRSCGSRAPSRSAWSR